MDDETTEPTQQAAGADPWAAQPATAPDQQVADPALLALQPLAAGTAPGWYRTTAGTDLRYWDGTAWTSHTAPGEEPKATYGQRFRRRFWLVLLVVSGLYALYAIAGIAKPGLIGTSSNRTAAFGVGTAIGAVLGIFLVALVVTALAAIVPGPARIDPATGAPRPSRLRVWAALAAVATGVLFTFAFLRSEPVPVQTIATTKDGCHAFLDTMETMTRQKVTDSQLKASMQSLHDQALANDPQLAADIEPLISAPTQENSQKATTSILTRCVNNGDITKAEVQTWVDQLKADLANLGG